MQTANPYECLMLLVFFNVICVVRAMKNDLEKIRCFLSSLISNFPLEYAISRVQANQEGLKVNGECQLLVYADGISIPLVQQQN